MNIHKLYKGQVIKNYKELCTILDISLTNDRVVRLRNLERYCTYHKEGNKFIIDEVYETPLLNPKKNIERIGEINYNKKGGKMTIIEYNGSNNVVVEFENGYKTECTYGQFKSGLIRSPYDKRVHNIGYLGEYDKEYNPLSSNIYYKKWYGMMQRCYSKAYQKGMKTYEGCTVCEEWHCFDTFSKWMIDNYYNVYNEVMCLDKDILIKGNKIYSPETCVFVPENINLLFVKCDNSRGEYPIGVYYNEKLINKYSSSFHNHIINKQIYLGNFDSKEEAFKEYKKGKEIYIKEVAERYKEQIPLVLYDAMYNWIVEITD
jgi:hypothetical protein